jgi:hypothetical protein
MSYECEGHLKMDGFMEARTLDQVFCYAGKCRNEQQRSEAGTERDTGAEDLEANFAGIAFLLLLFCCCCACCGAVCKKLVGKTTGGGKGSGKGGNASGALLGRYWFKPKLVGGRSVGSAFEPIPKMRGTHEPTAPT